MDRLYEESLNSTLFGYENHLKSQRGITYAREAIFRFLCSKIEEYGSTAALESLLVREIDSIMKEYKTDDEELRLRMQMDVTKLMEAAEVLRRRAIDAN